MRGVDPAPARALRAPRGLAPADVRVPGARRVPRPQLEPLVLVPVAHGRGDDDAVVLVRDAEEARRVEAGRREGLVEEGREGRVSRARLAVGVDCQLRVGGG